jgi:hypothetical protein
MQTMIERFDDMKWSIIIKGSGEMMTKKKVYQS